MITQTQCPECKSYKVESFKSGAIKFGLGCIAGAIIALIFLPNHYIISIILALLGLLCVINGVRNSDDFTCKACNYKFKL